MKSKRNTAKTWYILLALFAVLIVVVVIVARQRSQKSTEVTTEKASLRTIIETVAANGKIQPALEVKISPYISGEVVELFVREGDSVKKGDMLARIDPTIYQSNFEQVEASFNSAKANMANTRARVAQAEAQFNKAKIDLNRNEQLWKQKVISDADWDAIKANYQVVSAEFEASKESLRATQFQVQNAEAALREARENLRRTSIYAPADGTVSKLNVEVGERVTGASQFSSGTEIMRLANLSNMEVRVEVSENDIPRVKINDTCIIEVDAYLGRKFKGYITEIATSALSSGLSVDQVTNFEVKVMMLKESYADLINPSDKIKSPFRPGMTATVDIQTRRAENVLTVPIQAVTTRDDTTALQKQARASIAAESKKQSAANKALQEYVFVADDNTARIKAIKTGIQDNSYIEVLEGLNEGDEVITGPYRVVSKSLRNGESIKRVEEVKLTKDGKK
ncbi:MAG TPA: efflux RND transporter periplasmic adaptor subunit [Bacteroidales bacterium]|nr:efflux RND transporter periplasmic adaptor subunit [Bacteroidales bacterium]